MHALAEAARTGSGSREMAARVMRPCRPASTASSTTRAEKAVASSRPTAPAHASELSDLIRRGQGLVGRLQALQGAAPCAYM